MRLRLLMTAWVAAAAVLSACGGGYCGRAEEIASSCGFAGFYPGDEACERQLESCDGPDDDAALDDYLTCLETDAECQDGSGDDLALVACYPKLQSASAACQGALAGG